MPDQERGLYPSTASSAREVKKGTPPFLNFSVSPYYLYLRERRIS